MPEAYKCPKCGANLRISENGTHMCPKCEQRYVIRPKCPETATSASTSAAEVYEGFTGYPYDGNFEMKISLPTKKNPLILLGRLTQLNYLNKKEGKSVEYWHRTKEPHPLLFVTSDLKTFIIAGGKMHIEKDENGKYWLHD